MDARFYMPDAVIFGQHDQLSEKTLQPYAFGYNNPIRFSDPTGMSGNDWIRKTVNGTSTWTYDPNVQTASQAEAAGYKNVADVAASATISSEGILGIGDIVIL